VTVGKRKRTALVHVPKSYDATKGASLVLAFHGYGGSAAGVQSQTKLDVAADERICIVAYAHGLGIASRGFNGETAAVSPRGSTLWTMSTWRAKSCGQSRRTTA
jgi:poly(3-hydroxybutyrate) depolymerase